MLYNYATTGIIGGKHFLRHPCDHYARGDIHFQPKPHGPTSKDGVGVEGCGAKGVGGERRLKL